MKTIGRTIVVAVMMTAAWGHAALPKVADAQERVPPGKAVEARLIDGIRSRLEAGRKDITIKKGRYTLTPKDGDAAYIELAGLNDVTIDFSGSELWGAERVAMLYLHDCTNVTVRNVVIDYPFNLTYTQARIEKVGPDGEWDVRIIPGYPCPSADYLKDSGRFYPVQAYDANTLELKNPMRISNKIAIERTGGDTYRVTGGQNRKGDVGDIAVWSVKPPWRPQQAVVNIVGCKGCTFADITAYSTPDSGFIEHASDDNRYLRCSLVRRPPETDPVKRAFRRLRSGNHDAFNSRRSFKGPLIDGCTLQYHGDDCINICGYYALVAERNGRTLRVAGSGAADILPGDTCQVLTSNGSTLPDVKVVAIEPAADTTPGERKTFESCKLYPGYAQRLKKAHLITLEKEVDLPPGSAIVSNRRQGNGFVIRNCTLGHNVGHGALIRASDGLIESNLIERVTYHGIEISYGYNWLEGGCSRNVTVRGNVLRDNGIGGVWVTGTSAVSGYPPVDSHRDITITDNVISGSRTGIEVWGCTGVDVRRNKITVRDVPNSHVLNLVNVKDVLK